MRTRKSWRKSWRTRWRTRWRLSVLRSPRVPSGSGVKRSRPTPSSLCFAKTSQVGTVQYSTVQYVSASTSAHVTCDCSLSRPRVQPSAAGCPGGSGSSEQSDQSLPLRLHQHPRQLRPPALHHGGEAEVGQVLSVLEEGENELSKTVLLLITDNQMFSTNHGKRRR